MGIGYETRSLMVVVRDSYDFWVGFWIYFMIFCCWVGVVIVWLDCCGSDVEDCLGFIGGVLW